VLKYRRPFRPKEERIMRRDVWIFLFAIGVMMFTWPIMSIFRDGLPVYLFVIWLVFILLIFITSIFLERKDGGG
jgi:Ca2+/Na+ antiporter